MDFQNWTLASNARWRLTEVQLPMLWQAEFPNSRSHYTIKNVRSVRNLFDHGRHNNDRPQSPVAETLPRRSCVCTEIGTRRELFRLTDLAPPVVCARLISHDRNAGCAPSSTPPFSYRLDNLRARTIISTACSTRAVNPSHQRPQVPSSQPPAASGTSRRPPRPPARQDCPTSQMPEYLRFVRHLDSLLRDHATGHIRHDEIEKVLNGGAATALRRLVPYSARRTTGAFFTPTTILNATTQLLEGRLTSSSVVYDPACGAGDLLLAAARVLPWDTTSQEAWNYRIIGRDLCPQFTAAARRRLLLQAVHHQSFTALPAFPRIRTGCGLSATLALREATHVVLNPPFGPHLAPPDAPWASGRVSQAATFLWRLLPRLRPGTEILAILPDVLRSGTNYAAWRRTITQRADITSVRFFAQFDHATNVHATLLTFVAKPFDNAAPFVDWIDYQVPLGSRIADHFDVRVGSVVHFRDPHDGVRYPYVHSRNLIPWATIRSLDDSRLSVRPPLYPPLVAVRRMSRPGDPERALATIVALDERLLTLTPRHGGLGACQRLLAQLKQPTTTEALNKRIRCRHLTVSALSDLEFH